MKNFTQWFILFMATLTGAAIAQYYKFFSFVVDNDVSYLSLVIMFLFLIGSLLNGYSTWKYDRLGWYYLNDRIKYVLKPLRISKFLSENMLALGLLGTLVGFIFLLSKTLVETEDVDVIISGIKSGTGIALLTSLVGLISSLLLQLQVFVFEYNIKDE